MKSLIFSAIFAVLSFTSNSQIINVQTFEFQQVTLTATDTIYSEPYTFEASYTFDLTQNTLTSFIDNKTVISNLIRYADLYDGTMVFVYQNSPSEGWYVNTKTHSVSFFQMQWSVDVESRITKSIFIVY